MGKWKFVGQAGVEWAIQPDAASSSDPDISALYANSTTSGTSGTSGTNGIPAMGDTALKDLLAASTKYILETSVTFAEDGIAYYNGEEIIDAPPKNPDLPAKTPGSLSGGAAGSSGSMYGKDINSRVYIAGRVVSGEGASQKVEEEGTKINMGQAPKSLFNDWSLVKYTAIKDHTASDVGPIAKKYGQIISPDEMYDPTAATIIKYANSLDSKSFNYKAADFVQCKHYGQISNDYMITLRRFAYPIPDDIIDTKEFIKNKAMDSTQPDLARAITWMSPALGNDIKEVLKFSVGFEWKEAEAALQTLQAASSTGNKRGALGAWLDGNGVASAIEAGINGYSADKAARANMYQGGGDPYGDTYPNHVYGPLNVIKKTYNRDQGLNFTQEFTIKFHYDLRGYYGTSPKVAFMDTMANLLALTYNNAPFWGGATRYTGGGTGNTTGKPFGDRKALAEGRYGDFAKSLLSDVTGAAGKLKDAGNALFGSVQQLMSGDISGALNSLGDNNILDNLVGGGIMKMLGGPTGASGGQAANALLTGDPSGQWHLTIGNPISPIAVIGNLALDGADFEFGGPIGLEGFPSEVIMTCKLKPGRHRDKGDIESMFNGGKGRIYLQPDIENTVDLDEIYDVSRYGNKDIRSRSGRVLLDRASSMAND